MQVELAAAKDGQPTLRAVLDNGRQVFLHSSYSPQKEAQNWVKELNWAPNSLLVVFGLGLGYHIRELFSRMEAHQKLIIVEPNSKVLQMAQELKENQALFGQDHLRIAKDWDEFKDTYTQVGSPWENVFFSKIPSYPQVYEQEYLSFIKKLRMEINSLRSNLSTTLFFSREWQKNLLKNLPCLRESVPVSSLFGRLKGKPVIIVSAGPSLAKNVELLHEAKDRALIVAVGTVARLLLEKGISPDLIISFDGGHLNYVHHFQGLQNPGIPLVYDPAIHYKILEEYGGPKVIMTVNPANLWLDRELDQLIGLLRIGPSVSNTAFDLAYRLGADPIIFVGQDLAYTDQKTHAEGTHLEGFEDFQYHVPDFWLKSSPGSRDQSADDFSEKYIEYWSNQRLAWVEGVDGQSVPTDAKMLTFLHWFEETFRSLGEPRTIIDATEGGARIEGTQIMPLAEVLSLYCKQDLTSTLTSLREQLLQPPDFTLGRFTEYLKTVERKLQQLAPLLGKAVKHSQKLLDHYSIGKTCNVRRTLAKLARVDRKLKAVKEERELLHYIINPVLGMFTNAHIRGPRADLEASKQSLSFYSSLLNAFEFALPLIREAVRALDTDQMIQFEEVEPGGHYSPMVSGIDHAKEANNVGR